MQIRKQNRSSPVQDVVEGDLIRLRTYDSFTAVWVIVHPRNPRSAPHMHKYTKTLWAIIHCSRFFHPCLCLSDLISARMLEVKGTRKQKKNTRRRARGLPGVFTVDPVLQIFINWLMFPGKRPVVVLIEPQFYNFWHIPQKSSTSKLVGSCLNSG